MARVTKNKENKLDTREIFDNFEKDMRVYFEKERLLLKKILAKLEKATSFAH